MKKNDKVLVTGKVISFIALGFAIESIIITLYRPEFFRIIGLFGTIILAVSFGIIMELVYRNFFRI